MYMLLAYYLEAALGKSAPLSCLRAKSQLDKPLPQLFVGLTSHINLPLSGRSWIEQFGCQNDIWSGTHHVVVWAYWIIGSFRSDAIDLSLTFIPFVMIFCLTLHCWCYICECLQGCEFLIMISFHLRRYLFNCAEGCSRSLNFSGWVSEPWPDCISMFNWHSICIYMLSAFFWPIMEYTSFVGHLCLHLQHSSSVTFPLFDFIILYS